MILNTTARHIKLYTDIYLASNYNLMVYISLQSSKYLVLTYSLDGMKS